MQDRKHPYCHPVSGNHVVPHIDDRLPRSLGDAVVITTCGPPDLVSSPPRGEPVILREGDDKVDQVVRVVGWRDQFCLTYDCFLPTRTETARGLSSAVWLPNYWSAGAEEPSPI
jgi:hypothetical protein